MTKKDFWRMASRWGMIGGVALFVMNLIAMALELEANGHSTMKELLHFIVICPLIIITAKQNARLAGAEGYSYGRAVGFVFATMMFAGIVYGVGQFFLMNFIAPDYFDAVNAKNLETSLAAMSASLSGEQLDMIIQQQTMMQRWATNPFILIFSGIFEMVIKGGFLGLVLCGFLYRKPDIFADTQSSADVKTDDESRNE
jgi:hypothetical protein